MAAIVADVKWLESVRSRSVFYCVKFVGMGIECRPLWKLLRYASTSSDSCADAIVANMSPNKTNMICGSRFIQQDYTIMRLLLSKLLCKGCQF